MVHTPEVTTRDEESVRDTGTNRESDLNARSTGPKVRAICLVKAATRPTACIQNGCTLGTLVIQSWLAVKTGVVRRREACRSSGV